MALQATYEHITQTISETETTTMVVEFPSNLPPEHPNYELRGTTGSIETPVVTTTSSSIENAYIIITNYTFYKNEIDDNGNHLFDISYRVYNSQAEREANIDSHVYGESILGQCVAIAPNDDLRAKGYELLKNQVYIISAIDI